MDILYNLKITVDGGTKYDFAHVLNLTNEFITNMMVKNRAAIFTDADNSLTLLAATSADNLAYLNANIQVVKNKLGLNKLVYNLDTANRAAGNPSILTEKLSRAKIFSELTANFVLLLTHSLYWINIRNAAGVIVCEKSSIPLTNCFDFAIKVGTEITRMFEKRLDEEYSIANAIVEEFGPKGLKRKT